MSESPACPDAPRRHSDDDARRGARMASVLETAVDGIVVIDEHGTIDTFNPAAERMFGWTEEELVGRNVNVLMPEPFRSEHDGYLASYLRTGEARIIGIGREVIARRRDGSTFPVQLGVSEFQDGERRMFTGILRDVTEEKRVEDELRESRRALSSFIGNLPGTAYRCDPGGARRLRFVSAACREMFARGPDELLAEGAPGLNDLTHPADRAAVDAEIAQALEEERPYRLMYRVPGDGGEVRWVLEHGCGVRGPDGDLRALEGVVLDVTERKQLEQEFLQAQKMEAVGRLAGGIAHDFNNLLTGVISGCQIVEGMLGDGDDPSAVLEAVRREALRGASMTRQLLDFSRKSARDLQTTDLEKVVAQAEGMLRSLIGEDIELAVELAASGERIEADDAQLTQILMNLVVNARDAMPQGGRLCLRVGVEDLASPPGHLGPGSYVVLEVSDTGCGMDEATRERVFEPFFTTKEVGKGTGLGLSTVFGVVREFGGAIDLRSEPGHGTTFRLCFPRRGSASPAEAESADAAEAADRRGTGRILVVEDEPLVRAGIRHILSRLGYDVRAAADPLEALQIAEAEEGRFDLMLTDIVMPGMNGPELARRVGASWPGIRVAFMSAFSDRALVEQGRIDSGIPVLEKPFEEEQLAERVRSLLAQRS